MNHTQSSAAMLRLEFNQPSPDAKGTVSSTVGPSNVFRFSHNNIYEAFSDEILASFLAPAWSTQGQRFTGFQCRGQSVIHFERRDGEVSRHYGPFADVVFHEASVRVAHGQLFAAYQNQNRLWHSFVLSSDWSMMVLTATAFAGTRVPTGIVL